ncbi:hypothetical protein [Iodobacter sp.]|uniref:hypothetical protein n=1 Tax=Iodobacter sp. TaxID=1915058 RepID=UPI0025DFE818|nr:hypothetical protein [Iodobacter sp.]
MEHNQQQINLNVQERLRALEATHQINLSMLMALIATHPNPVLAKRSFLEGSERLVAMWLNSPLKEDWIERGVDYHGVLLQHLEHTIATSK